MPDPTIDPENYATQLNNKLAAMEQLFQEFPHPDIEVFESPPLHYRMRAEFRIWYENGLPHYVMFKPGDNKQPLKLDTFPTGSLRINQLMPELLASIRNSKRLSERLFQVEFLTTLSGEALISLIYHQPLDDHWLNEAKQLGIKLDAQIVGRSRKQRVVPDRDYVNEQLTINGRAYCYQQPENTFTQPNAVVNQRMLGWIQDKADNPDSDLLELYCGNGNFTVVLAPRFARVLATEVSKTAVKAAQHNLTLNHCHNVDIVRMSSEDLTMALNQQRPFRRLKTIDLPGYRFSTVLVDPPRAGLDPDTIELLRRFDTILYISCNPITLTQNIRALGSEYQISGLALFDQFPYTPHIESGVLLQRL